VPSANAEKVPATINYLRIARLPEAQPLPLISRRSACSAGSSAHNLQYPIQYVHGVISAPSLSVPGKALRTAECPLLGVQRRYVEIQ
jgi:hypothetical protein